MSESEKDGAAVTWSVPECPFTIETSARVLDDIRLAVTDAFFSLPRGGAEIGGILLGTYRHDKVMIGDYAALDCEHAFGPSFQLSPPDEERLTQLLAAHDGCAGGLRPVGWYHSHTRSEIFLSDADLGIYRRFFPEAWQVALVLRPHTFEPTRIGFFFRQADGAVYARASRREVQLEALPMRQMPAGPPTAQEPAASQPRNLRPAQTFAPVVDIPAASGPANSAGVSESSPFLVPPPSSFTAAPAPPPSSFTPAPPPSPFAVPPRPPAIANPAAASEPVIAAPIRTAREDTILENTPPALAELPVPKFVVESASSTRKWMTVGIAIVGGLGVGAAGYKTQEMWLPRLLAAISPAQSAAPARASAARGLGLTTFDREGQLQIYWERTSAGVSNASYGVLEITEAGTVPKAIQLDSASLQTGSFSYQRTTAKVDVKLTIYQKAGAELRESSSFLGSVPDRKARGEAEALKAREAEAIRQRDEMAMQTAKMKADLTSQAAKTKKLEKDMQSIREEMKLQQQRRLANQVPDK